MDWIVIAGLTGGAVTVVDERDEVQKKTFTKWINKHLVKVASHLYTSGSVHEEAHPCFPYFS